MMRYVHYPRAWGVTLAVAAAALAALWGACSSNTSPHQPTPCPTYSGGLPAGDSLFGTYSLVSYCVETLPAFAPPVDTGHVVLKRAAPHDSFLAVIGTQGQPAESISGTYTLPPTDSIDVTGQLKPPGIPVSVPVTLQGRFQLQAKTLSVSGLLTVTGQGSQSVSFVGARP